MNYGYHCYNGIIKILVVLMYKNLYVLHEFEHFPRPEISPGGSFTKGLGAFFSVQSIPDFPPKWFSETVPRLLARLQFECLPQEITGDQEMARVWPTCLLALMKIYGRILDGRS
jgi:hypothetical protein